MNLLGIRIEHNKIYVDSILYDRDMLIRCLSNKGNKPKVYNKNVIISNVIFRYTKDKRLSLIKLCDTKEVKIGSSFVINENGSELDVVNKLRITRMVYNKHVEIINEYDNFLTRLINRPNGTIMELYYIWR